MEKNFDCPQIFSKSSFIAILHPGNGILTPGKYLPITKNYLPITKKYLPIGIRISSHYGK
jgi:hypothetical protein